MSGLGALTFDGRLLGVRDQMYAGYGGEYVPGNYSDWKHLKFIDGCYHYVGIKNDGSLIAMGKNKEGECNIQGITNVKKVSVNGASRTAFLLNDGTVKVVGLDVPGHEDWEDIVDIASDFSGIYGFKADGTVCFAQRKPEGSLAKYRKYRGTHPSEWKDIYKYFDDCKAIDKYGRAYAYGDYDTDAKLDGLKDIVYIAQNSNLFLVCIKADGTLVPLKSEIDISKWENIISIWGSNGRVVGLKADGTVICDGDINYKEELES